MMDATTLPKLQKPNNHMESHGDYSWVVAILPRIRVIVCRDNWQWIIQRRSGTRRRGAYFRSVSYHRSRDTLKRRWRGFVGAEESTEELGSLPEYFGRGE